MAGKKRGGRRKKTLEEQHAIKFDHGAFNKGYNDWLRRHGMGTEGWRGANARKKVSKEIRESPEELAGAREIVLKGPGL